MRDPIRHIETVNSYSIRSRGEPLLAGRGLTTMVRNNPSDPLAILYRYVQDGVERWTETAILTPPGDYVNDRFGGTFSGAVSINYFYNMDLIQTHVAGNVVIVGAAYNDGSESNTGAVYIYSGEWSKWSHQQTLTLETQNENDFFGTSVAFNQADFTTAAVTCLGCDPFYANTSATYIYGSEPPFHNRWSQQQVLIPYDKNLLYLGYGLKMHKDTLVISGTSPDDWVLSTYDGWYGTGIQDHIYIYHRPPGSRFWTEQQQLEGAVDSYSLSFMVQLEDDTIGISDGRKSYYEQGTLKIYYPDTPRYHEKPQADSWHEDHSTTSSFILNDAKPRPRSPQWSLQQILVDPLATADAGFGSYFTFHGNSLAVTRPIDSYYTPGNNALYIYERPYLGGQWSVQQIFQFSVARFFPVTWYGTNIVWAQTGNDVRMFSSSQEWSCLIISMEDAFGDGWDNAMLLASAPDGTFDKYRPYCDTVNPISFRYCPLDGADRGLYKFTIEDAPKSKFHWEIQWQIFEEKTGTWYRGDHRTRMDFYWEPTTRDFTRRGIVHDVPLNISCINNCKPKPTPKPSPSEPAFRALKSSTNAPTITPAPTLAQTEDTVWEYFSMTGDGWFDNAHRGTNYYISDIHGLRLLSTGTKCDEFATQSCWQTLPDGEYILRVTGHLNTDGSTRQWSFCGRNGATMDMLVFEVANGQCDALEYYSRSTYCQNKLDTTAVADVTFLLMNIIEITEQDRIDLSSSLSYLFPEMTSENIHIRSAIPSNGNMILNIVFNIPVVSYGYDVEDFSSIKQTYNTFITKLQNYNNNGKLREIISTTITTSELNHVLNINILDNHPQYYEILPNSLSNKEDQTVITYEPPSVPITYYENQKSSSYTLTDYIFITEKILLYSTSAIGYIIFGSIILIILLYIQSKISPIISPTISSSTSSSTSTSSTIKDENMTQNILLTTEKNINLINKQIKSNANVIERNFINFLDDIGDVVVEIISPPPEEDEDEENNNPT